MTLSSEARANVERKVARRPRGAHINFIIRVGQPGLHRFLKVRTSMASCRQERATKTSAQTTASAHSTRPCMHQPAKPKTGLVNRVARVGVPRAPPSQTCVRRAARCSGTASGCVGLLAKPAVSAASWRPARARAASPWACRTRPYGGNRFWTSGHLDASALSDFAPRSATSVRDGMAVGAVVAAVFDAVITLGFFFLSVFLY